ncbi:MAG: bifunctional riboflavin kinase/FAD synthetase [Lachnospiraceae bacterium]|nr:bifunctional riboflavin kinase/FAD synthetase [Lachnospiraceae bacterium]
MIYLTDRTDVKIEYETALTLGKFDGIHRGHRKLLSKVMEHSPGLKTVVFTFDINPTIAVSGSPGTVLTTNEERRSVVERFGIDYLYECPFTEEIRNMEAADFVRKIVNDLNVRYIAVGSDFGFGHNRAGDYRLLQDLADELGYSVEVVDKVMYGDREISSTYIREVIAGGDMVTAQKMLGYPYTVEGTVGYGRQLGRTIGIPTTNVIPIKAKLLPPNGVYVSRVRIDGEEHPGVTNIGVKPTVGDENEKGAETFIFDFDRDVYGHEISIELFYYIRAEKKFLSIADLKAQMEKDISFTREYQIDKSEIF